MKSNLGRSLNHQLGPAGERSPDNRVASAKPRPLQQRFETRVVAEERPSHDLVLLRLELPPGTEYAFKPGQFAYVYPDGVPGESRAAYSIASPPEDQGHLDLAVKMVNPNGVSGWLYAREAGDTVRLSKALGGFVFRTPPGVAAVFLATGTGVAPFRSMIKHLLNSGDTRPMWLFLGSGKPADLPYHREFEAMAAAHPNLHYVPTLSRAGTFAWNGERGWIQEAFLRRFTHQTGYEAYVCGVKVMVDDVRSLLRSQGLGEKQIHLERYV